VEMSSAAASRSSLNVNRSVEKSRRELGGFYADRSRDAAVEDAVGGGTVEDRMQRLERVVLATNDTMRATLQVMRDLQSDMRELRLSQRDVAVEVRNVRAVQRNGHSYRPNHKMHRVMKRRSDGEWRQPLLDSFPKTIGGFRRLSNAKLADLCKFYEITVDGFVERPGSVDSNTTEMDVSDGANVAVHRREFLEALAAEFGVPFHRLDPPVQMFTRLT